MRRRILVVDNDEQHRARLTALLGQQNLYVEAATDGLDAVQRARLGWFDVILMNTDIPEVDGIAAARLITVLTQDHGSPRIIALAGDPADLRQRCEGGRDAFFAIVARPCEADDVLEEIRRATAENASRCCGQQTVWPSRRAATARSRFRILLVDDDDAPRDVLGSLLSEQGYDVEPARDGLEALLMMGSSVYDAAVLDYDLPRMNGVAAARLVHDLLAGRDRPSLIALTATPAAVRERQRMSLPLFDDIIPKSVGFISVVGAVKRCLQSGSPRPA